MEISICFGESRESLAGGFGFTETGAWRGGALPEGAGRTSEACASAAETSRFCHSERSEESASTVPCCLLPVASGRETRPLRAAGLIVDDRFLPDRRGLAAARQALGGWRGLLIFDFERPPSPLAAELVRALSGARRVLPPAWAELPHAAVLVGPWPGRPAFPRWLEARRARYGEVILDAAPLRAVAAPGGPWKPWPAPLPDEGFPCPALGCLHRRLPDGRLLFWDTKETLRTRLRSAGVPAIVFSADWAGFE